jgi:hypothetical protein
MLWLVQAKNTTYGPCIGPNFNESQPTNGQVREGVLEAF